MHSLILAGLILASSIAFAAVDGQAPAALKLPGQDILDQCGQALAEGEQGTLDANKLNEIIQDFLKEMKSTIIGQDAAADTIGDGLDMLMSLLTDSDKPMGRYFFMGPTGVGKTELVKSFIRWLKANPDKMLLRFDGGELQMDHDISRIIGAPPGYKGHGDKSALHPDNIAGARVKITLKNGTVIEFTVLLWDEIEKMSDAVFKLMLGILDNGMAKLGDGTPTALRKTIMIATSNLGAKDVKRLVDLKKLIVKGEKDLPLDSLPLNDDLKKHFKTIYEKVLKGEQLTDAEKDLTGRRDLVLRQAIYDTYIQAVDERFAPEFKARWQKFIQFLHLERQEFLQISDVMLSKVQKRIFEQALIKFNFQVTPAAKEWLVDKGTDFQNGARELQNTIELELVKRFARLISTDQVAFGDVLLVDVKDGELSFKKLRRGLNEEQMKRYADAVFPGKKMLKVVFKVGMGDDPLEDKPAIIQALLREIDRYPLARTGLWQSAVKSKTKNDTIASADGPAEAIAYKYIDVDGVIMKMYYSSKTLAAVKEKTPNAMATDLPFVMEVVRSGIPEAEKMLDYSGTNIYRITIKDLESLLAQAKTQPPSQ